MIFLYFLAADPPVQPSFLESIFGNGFFMIVILFVMMYVLMIRPQQKQRKAAEARIAALKKGDKVVTIGGLHGVVHHISDKTVTLTVSEQVFLKFDKASVRDVTKKTAGGDSSANGDSDGSSAEDPKK
ncbi:MAG: preprotein translocase subunit YajC [Verrucomicrobia bacterium]|nr:preprotein translocase subunit YajC [Verrucomicrobiota bacterium]MDA1004996.1 preprotein translocase subunit YajC [Verrucomicrobiota bacterium]